MYTRFIKIFLALLLTGTAIYLWVDRTIQKHEIIGLAGGYSGQPTTEPMPAPPTPGTDPVVAAIQRLDALLTQRITVGGGNSLTAQAETGRLVQEISAYKDPRALNVLLRVLKEQGGPITGLVDLGEIAVDPMIEMTKDPSVRRPLYVYWTLAQYVDKDHRIATLNNFGIKNRLVLFFSDCKDDNNQMIRQTCQNSLTALQKPPPD